MTKLIQCTSLSVALAWSTSSMALPLIEITVPLEMSDLPQEVNSILVSCHLDNFRKGWHERALKSVLMDRTTGRPTSDRVVLRFNNLQNIPFMPESWRCSFSFQDTAGNFLDRNNDARYQPASNTPFVDWVSASFQSAPATP